MSGEKRAFGGHMLAVIFGGLAAIVIAGAFVPGYTIIKHSPYGEEISHVKQLVIACASFAIDNEDGKFPKSLDELYPEYMLTEESLKFKGRKTGESEPYTYFTNLEITDFSGTPLIVSPVIKSKEYDFRIVGYVGGHVIKMKNDEYLKMISK